MNFISKYTSLTLFCVYSGKMLVMGATLVDAPIIAILALFSGYVLFKSENKQIKDLNDKIDTLTKKIEEQDKTIESVKSYVGSLKLMTNMKPGSLGNVR